LVSASERMGEPSGAFTSPSMPPGSGGATPNPEARCGGQIDAVYAHCVVPHSAQQLAPRRPGHLVYLVRHRADQGVGPGSICQELIPGNRVRTGVHTDLVG
jgi:hypothetical protein